MTTHGPFHSLSDSDKHALAKLLADNDNVHRAALTLGLNYTHALNYAHSLGYGYRRPTNQDAVDRAVDLVALGTPLQHAADQCGTNITAVFHAATKAGVHHPRTVPRGHAVTTRRVEYLQLRLSALNRKDAAKACQITIRTARDYDKGLTKPTDGPRVRFIAQGPDAVVYNRLMTAVLTQTDVIEPGREAEPAASALIDPYRQIHTRYLSLVERERICDLRAAGHSVRGIAGVLSRSASTISRELRRNHTAAGPYAPLAAQRKAAARRLRPKKSVIASDPELKAVIQAKISDFWSPEQITGWSRLHHPEKKRWHVCNETIYQALYLQARGGLKRQVQQALRQGRGSRKPRYGTQERKKCFVDDMVMIAQRPEEVEGRLVPGHWEGDLITGAYNKSAIATLVERTSRYVMLVHLPGAHDADSVLAGLKATIPTLPKHLQGSLTWDQGSEMAGHKKFTVDTGCQVYFCDPGSPWQRGSNENTNGLLRQYFPKGSDLSVHSAQDLQFVAQQLSNRPRKTLEYRTPAEVFRDLIDGD